MRRVVLYIAASVDGYIAGPDDDISWLQPFEDVDYGYDAFIESVGAVVLGRRTYDVAVESGWGWPYPVPGYVLTGRPPADPPEGAEITFTDRPLPELVAEAAARIPDDKDLWVVGGAAMVRGFLAAGLIDQVGCSSSRCCSGRGPGCSSRSADRPRSASSEPPASPRGWSSWSTTSSADAGQSGAAGP